MSFCVDIKEYSKTKEIGSKAYKLMKSSNFTNVPDGFILKSNVYERFINNFLDDIKYYIKLVKSKKMKADKASKIIKGLILKSRLNSEIRQEILKYLKNIKEPYAVRSSATVEDSKKYSFAGIFDSFLNVKKQDVEDKIKRVIASTFNSGSILYAIKNKIDIKSIKMAVIVQEMVNGNKFGVGFSLTDNKKNIKIIECSLKDPDAVTSGKIIPDLYILKGDNVEYHTFKIGISNLFPFEIHKISEMLKKLKTVLYPIDIEFAFDENKLILLQIRDLTTKVNIPFINESTKKFWGIPIYQGIIESKAVVQKFPKQNEIYNGKILVSDVIDINDIGIIKNFSGFIIENAGLTSHVAILAREYKIPTIVGVRDATKIIHNGEKIRIDGSKGVIELVDRKGLNKKFQNRLFPMVFDLNKMILFSDSRDAAILYPIEDYFIVSYNIKFIHPDYKKRFLNEELPEIISKIKKKYNYTLVDGGYDLYGDCGLIFEMRKTHMDIDHAFRKGLKILKSMDKGKIENEIKFLINESSECISKANGLYNDYILSKNKRSLSSALEMIYKGWAYWLISSKCMLDIQSDYMISHMDGIKADKFRELIRKMWDYELIKDVDDSVYLDNMMSLLTNINVKINYDLHINKNMKKFTSYLACINDVKSATSTKLPVKK